MAASKRKASPQAVARSTKKVRLETQGQYHEEATPSSRSCVDGTSVAETSISSRSAAKRPKKYFCTYHGCTKAFDRPVRLDAHIRTHTNDKPFACEEDGCTKRFFKAEHLKAHVQNKHSNEANHVCTYLVIIGDGREHQKCGKSFTIATRLRRHVATHEKKEEMKCKEEGCGMVFRKMETLQRHIRKEHTDEDEFKCTAVVVVGDVEEEECGEMFTTIAKLKTHENREHSGPKYFCDYCPAPSTPEDMDAQLEEGSGMDDISLAFEDMERPGFPTYADLQAHIKAVHPPTCTTCGKTCPSNRALVAHMDIEHSSLDARQNYACAWPGCGRSFTRNGNLKVHIQTVHVQAKNFICGIFDLSDSDKIPGWDGHGCGMNFGTKANLESHIRTQHLNLPDVHHPRKTKKIKAEDFPETTPSLISADAATPVDEPSETLAGQPLSLLTGNGLAVNRPFACWDTQCDRRFAREYGLAQHMELVHGWNVDDINDKFAEKAALAGEDFYIGGDVESAGGMFGSEQVYENEKVELALVQDDEKTHVSHEMMMPIFAAGPLFDGMEDDALVLDPALLAN